MNTNNETMTNHSNSSCAIEVSQASISKTSMRGRSNVNLNKFPN